MEEEIGMEIIKSDHSRLRKMKENMTIIMMTMMKRRRMAATTMEEEDPHRRREVKKRLWEGGASTET